MAAHATEAEARDVAEAARETEWNDPSFAAELFLGRFRPELIHPHPPIDDPAEAARAAPFMAKLRDLLIRVDSDAIDRTGEIPEELVQELRDIGAFGIKIATEFGGLGLSHLTYVRAMELVTSKDGNLTALLSASQSIGLPQPLKLFGTPEQQRRFFPRLAKGAISAFALPVRDVAHESEDRLFVPGSILRLDVDASRPLAYGMEPHTAAFFAFSSAFEVAAGMDTIARYGSKDLLLSGTKISANDADDPNISKETRGD